MRIQRRARMEIPGRERAIVGRAMTTILVSSDAISVPTVVTARAVHR